MDKQSSAIFDHVLKPAWNAGAKYLSKHPRLATGAKITAALPAGFALGALPATALTDKSTGRATYGEPNDLLPKGSYWNTFNPISSVTGGVDKIPEWYVKLFPNTARGKQTAHLSFKAGATGLLAAALVGGYRTAKHYAEMDELSESDRPSKGIAGQLSTTFEGELTDSKSKSRKKKQKKEASGGRIPDPGILTWQNFLGSSIPLGASLLAASLMYNGVDKYFDKKRNEALDEAIKSKEDAIKQLITARARMAKGTGSDSEIAAATKDLGSKDIFVKGASQDKKALLSMNDILQHFGALTSAVIIASALGSYYYTSAGDDNNVAYKAYQKAMKEYAKNKSGITPITIAPTDATSYFEKIDEGADNTDTSARKQPSIDTDDMNKPISISF